MTDFIDIARTLTAPLVNEWGDDLRIFANPSMIPEGTSDIDGIPVYAQPGTPLDYVGAMPAWKWPEVNDMIQRFLMEDDE